VKENIFEINNLNNLKQNNFCFEMKNFYKNPNAVCKLLNSKSPYIHKWGEKNSLNTIDFFDCRHKFISEDFKKTEIKIYKYLNRDIINAKGFVLTNFIKFLKNNFKDNYWWPHTDNNLYNCIIYLNTKPCDGTNIYSQTQKSEGGEHSSPWQSKNKYILLQNIEAEYNKLVIFKSHLYHGMAYNSDKFNDTFRKNQVIFIK
jgi:hypothetical protein|tara:strand:- start:39 stop:641 length:603 start_codon:yes stop_codon:yes gene_type:complete